MRCPKVLEERLLTVEKEGCFRQLTLRRGMDLCSNDYLGFADDPELRKQVRARLGEVPLGSGGSRLLRGHLELFDEVEGLLARFCGREASLLFPSGYQANIGLMSAILRPGDCVLSDERNHASIIDGIRLSRAERHVFPHRDVQALRRVLESFEGTSGLKVIVTESLFSMDGDVAPLRELAELAEEHSALLIVDEAHATGLWGDKVAGGGIVQSLGLTARVFATVHTGGKALGCAGAWIACEPSLKRYLVNFSRPFIFSTAPMPLFAAALREAILHWGAVGAQRAVVVHESSERFKRLVREMGLEIDGTGPILPVMLGGNERALRVADHLASLGFDIRAIRPPTVAEGKARLRVTIRWGMEAGVLERFAWALGHALQSIRG